MDHAHLRPEMRDLAMLPATERLALTLVHRWIGYTCAAQILGRLEDMLTREPGRVRPRCMLVIGPANNGKTAIAERFLHGHPQHASVNGEHEVIPVLSMQMPPSPTPARLWASILHSLGVPLFLRGRSSPDREVFALRLLCTVGCRAVVIDELHDLLDAPAQRQRELLSLPRFLINELQIPLVCLGTREAWLAVRSDDQLENRFEPSSYHLGKTIASLGGCSPASSHCCFCASRQDSERQRYAQGYYAIPEAQSARSRRCLPPRRLRRSGLGRSTSGSPRLKQQITSHQRPVGACLKRR